LYNHFFFAFCLTEVIFKVATMRVVVKSVMRASLTILMWLTLLLFVVYWTSLMSFGMFRYAFGNPSKGCQTLWQCAMTNFDGLRNGGGVGSVMSGLQWELIVADNGVTVPTLSTHEYMRLLGSFVYFMVVSRLFVAVYVVCSRLLSSATHVPHPFLLFSDLMVLLFLLSLR
jgi:hypothetical protein